MLVPEELPEKLLAEMVPSTDKFATPTPEFAILNVLSLPWLKSKVIDDPLKGIFVSDIVKLEKVQAPDTDCV